MSAPSERSIELAIVALESAASACGDWFGTGDNDTAKLADEYRQAVKEFEEWSP